MAIQVQKTIPLPKEGDKMLTKAEGDYVEMRLNAEPGTISKGMQELAKAGGRDISERSASVRAAELKKRDNVMAVLEAHATKAEANIVDIAEYSTKLGKTGGKDGAAYAGVALAANDKILDRVHGKAKQTLDVTTKSVTINMDLTSALPSESVVV